MFEQDADTYLADWGRPTTWVPSAGGATVTGLVILDQPDEDVDGGGVISRQYQATLATATWPGLKRGEVLTIDGVAYKLRTDPRAESDGLFSMVMLSKV